MSKNNKTIKFTSTPKKPTCPFCGGLLTIVCPTSDRNDDFHACMLCSATMKAPDIMARVAPPGFALVDLNGTDIMTSILKLAIKNREDAIALSAELRELKRSTEIVITGKKLFMED